MGSHGGKDFLLRSTLYNDGSETVIGGKKTSLSTTRGQGQRKRRSVSKFFKRPVIGAGRHSEGTTSAADYYPPSSGFRGSDFDEGRDERWMISNEQDLNPGLVLSFSAGLLLLREQNRLSGGGGSFGKRALVLLWAGI